MNENAKIVSDLSESAIGLAKAADNLGALNLAFGVFIVMMLALMIMFIAQVYTTNKRLNKMEDAAEKILGYFNPISLRTVGHEESKAIIRESVTRTSTMIKYYILKTKYENGLEVGSADDRIKGAIASEHNDRRALLGRFYINGRKLSFVCEDCDDSAMSELMKKYVYMDKSQFSASLMAQEVNYMMDGIKARYQSKIDELM